ncbi:hypothetical protein QIS74_09779 [Colletotrichum tabaci]|uniref:C2H2-type domain-containing protein n=1 Tax=Colletotrichum tabaci TaxID=1209068 RepID=A0AAV9T5I1_9PEZI
MSADDIRTLRALAGRYGSGSLENTLRSLGGSSINTNTNTNTNTDTTTGNSNNGTINSINNYTTLRPPPQHHQQHQNNPAPARNSTLSTSTFGSAHSAPPSLTSSGPWSGSDASLCGSSSDAASLAGSYYGTQQQQQQQQQNAAAAAWNDPNDVPFLLSPSVTPSLSGSEWQDLHVNEYLLSSPCGEKKAVVAAAVAAVSSPSRRKPIECPLCAVHDVRVGFGRKSDFKKHLQNFHNTDCLWACPRRGCRMVFDFERAYVVHLKTDHHSGSRDSSFHAATAPDRVRVELCPQVVFACGFVGCKTVIEAPDDGAAPAAADAFFDHLAGHFDRRATPTSSSSSSSSSPVCGWTYYHQIRNLLRQRALKDEWKHALWDKAARNQLRWQPRSSADLKKLLECRHLADVPRVLHAAWTLGQTFSSPKHPGPAFPGEATRPLRNRCPLSISGHDVGGDSHRRTFGQHLQQLPNAGAAVFHTTLATVSHPPPRCVPEEPDSLVYAHPGTPLVLPEHNAWSTDVVLGPREDFDDDDNNYNIHKNNNDGGDGGGHVPMVYAAAPNPVSPWIVGPGPGPGARPPPLCDPTTPDDEAFGALLRVPPPQPKRPRSWGMRSLENLRLKRRDRPSPPVDEKTLAMPAWI